MTEIIKVPLGKLYVLKLNNRDDTGDLTPLKNSIIANIKKNENPLIIPLLTRKDKDGDMYEILDGKRRFEATKLIGVSKSRIDGINYQEKKFRPESLRCEVIDVDDETAMMIINATDETFEHKSWYEKAKLYQRLRGKQLKTIGTTKRYERTTKEIRELIGKTVSETTIKQYLKSYEVIEHDEKAKGLPEKACRLISSRSKGDWSILIEKALEFNSTSKLEKLIKKVKKIRNEIELIFDIDVRKKVIKQIEPIIYEDDMTVDVADVIIAKAMGTYMNKIVVHLPKPNNNIFYNYFHSAEGYTEDQAKEYADKYNGKIIGEETFSFWRVYVDPCMQDMNLIPYTIDNLESNPPSIAYSKKRCEKCGRLIESRMMEKAKKQNYTNVFCANCVLKANKNIIYRR